MHPICRRRPCRAGRSRTFNWRRSPLRGMRMQFEGTSAGRQRIKKRRVFSGENGRQLLARTPDDCHGDGHTCEGVGQETPSAGPSRAPAPETPPRAGKAPNAPIPCLFPESNRPQPTGPVCPRTDRPTHRHGPPGPPWLYRASSSRIVAPSPPRGCEPSWRGGESLAGLNTPYLFWSSTISASSRRTSSIDRFSRRTMSLSTS